MTEDRFAQLVMDTLKRAGDLRQCRFVAPEFLLRFTTNGKENGSLNLRNLFAEYQTIPKPERSKWLSSRLVQLAKPAPFPEEFQEAAHDLRPSVRSRFFFESVRLSSQLDSETAAAMAFLPLSDYLAISLVYDLPKSMSFVTDKNLKSWNISTYEAFERARENLEHLPLAFAGIDRRVFISAVGDSYDATRMLMLDAIRQLPIEGAPVALPLTRECLLISGREDPKGLGMMLDLAEKRLEDPRPICSVAHNLRGDQWEPWLPEVGHPHIERFRRLKLRHEVQEYADQKHHLEKLHEKTHLDVFVAQVLVASKDGEPTYTIASWAKGITTWLPRIDKIGFFDPATKTMKLVSWDSARRVVGDFMEPVELYPPRWSVSRFPTDEQFAAMGTSAQ